MTPEEFRAAGHELIDWIADYRADIGQRRVLPDVEPGEIRARLPAEAPATAEPFDAVLADLDEVVMAGVTNVQHPMHFGWFPSNASLSSVLGDLASSGIGGLGISWESCPSLTEVEEVVCDWMRRLVGLSPRWHGTIQDTASTACVVALLAARERASDFSEMTGGIQSLTEPLVVYTTAEAHSSVTKAAAIAGFGLGNLRAVDVDPDTQAMVPESLEAMIADDLANGGRPTAVVASSGTTGVTAFDPLREIAAVIDRVDTPTPIWLHVDAAMAGSAMICEEFRPLWAGVEAADSVSFNPHKWLGTILDTSLFYVRDPEHLIRVFSSNPSYLQSEADGDVVNYRDWGIPLGRRFRALKLWFQLRLDGPDALRARIRRDVANADWLAAQVAEADDWELVVPRRLQTICLRHLPRPDAAPADLDAHTLAWARRLNRSGLAFVTPAQFEGSWMVRVSVGVETTELDDVQRLWSLLRRFAAGDGSAER